MAILIRNGYILTLDEKDHVWEKGEILIDKGEIVAIGERCDVSSYQIERIIDATDKLVIPGLINAHSHSYAALLKGTVDNIPLDIFMLYAIARGGYRNYREIYISTMVDCIEMLKTGTTTVIDHFAQRPAQKIEGIDAVVKAYLDSGMRATVAPMFADKRYYETIPLDIQSLPSWFLEHLSKVPLPQAEEYIEVCEEAIKKWQDRERRIQIMLGTDGTQRCTERLLRLTRELADKYNIGIHTHCLETKTQAIKGRELYGKNVTEHLDEMGLLTPKTSLVHFIWCTDKEIDLVAERGASIVHVPSTALMLGDGLAPVQKILDKGIPIALGTDGASLGNLSIFEKMRLAAIIHRLYQPNYERWITAREALRMGTEWGAKASLLAGKIGVIKVGARADLTILNGNTLLLKPLGNPLNQLIYRENGNSVEMVLVEGKIVVENGKLTLVNEKEILEEAEQVAKRLREQNREALNLVAKQIPYFRQMYFKALKQEMGINRFTTPPSEWTSYLPRE